MAEVRKRKQRGAYCEPRYFSGQNIIAFCSNQQYFGLLVIPPSIFLHQRTKECVDRCGSERENRQENEENRILNNNCQEFSTISVELLHSIESSPKHSFCSSHYNSYYCEVAKIFGFTVIEDLMAPMINFCHFISVGYL